MNKAKGSWLRAHLFFHPLHCY